MNRFNFGPASPGESRVFGAARPGYPSHSVAKDDIDSWLLFMHSRGIERVCCLLDDSQLAYYENDLLGTYRTAFGERNVCSAPTEDYRLCDLATLTGVVLPFLVASDREAMKVVVHCSAGMGRTGLVLAAWLVHARELRQEDALSTVKEMGRDPYQGVGTDAEKWSRLQGLLGGCEPNG